MIIEYNCIVCGTKCRKQRSPAGIKSFPKFCSQKCHGIHKHSLKVGTFPNYKGICEYCKKEFETYRSPSNMKLLPRFCSLQCLGKSQKGKNNPAYNGGKYISNGYYVLFKPDHPYRDAKNMVFEHRFVMECKIGRYLLPEEVVHHIDFNRINNDPANLMLFKNNSEHIKYHNNLKNKNNG